MLEQKIFFIEFKYFGLNLNRFYWMQIYFLKYQIFFIKRKCLLLNTNVILLLNINKYLLNVKYFWLNVNIKIRFCYKQGSSLILQHEYQTRATRMGHEWHTSDTSVTRRKKVGAIWATRVWHECYTNDTSATRVKNFDNDVWTFFFTPLYLLYGKWMITRRGTISF